jgi:hypothetical protein
MSILSNTLQAAAMVYALESWGVQEAQENDASVGSQGAAGLPFATYWRRRRWEERGSGRGAGGGRQHKERARLQQPWIEKMVWEETTLKGMA